MNQKLPFVLKEDINRHLDDGCRVFTKGDIAAAGAYDTIKIIACLKEWEQRGILKILLDYDMAQEADVVIEMLSYIDAVSPWPNWPKEKGLENRED